MRRANRAQFTIKLIFILARMTRNNKPFLTLGMATIDDFDGVYFTITSLMLHHGDAMDDCEIVVVDNHPHSKQGRMVEEWIRTSVPNGRYFAFDGPLGTAQARNEVFRRASGHAVLCLDCHVLLAAGTVRKLIDYYREHPQSRDLLSGPLLSESGQIAATDQRAAWRRGALGVWSIDERGRDPDGEPFEIWQQGMGLFSCRKDAWVGFHPEFRGFGGCESYIMEKIRRRGGRVLCCPWLRWTHRFQRPHGAPYETIVQDRIQNYLVGFLELGLDVQPVLDHFNGEGAAQRHLLPPKQTKKMNEIAVVGNLKYGGVTMRGLSLSKHLSCKLISPRQVREIARRRTIVAIKKDFCPTTVRGKCDRLVYDPLDVFCDVRDNVDPLVYWRASFEQLKFNDIIATSPACHDAMRAALPSDVAVHMIPHPCDPRIEKNWRNPDGPVVYSGLRQYVESGIDRIRHACRLIGKEFVIGPSCEVLRGASLALALRLPPYNTELNRRCKPQIKLENAAAAGLPLVSTDCPAAVSLHPEIERVPADFSAKCLAQAMRHALDGPGLSEAFDTEQYLTEMEQTLQRKTVVVYTAIFGGYDELHDPHELLPGVEYVCFTDNPRLKSDVWRICYCPPAGDPLLQAKRIKILAHEALHCAVSVWIDGQIELHSLNRAIAWFKTDVAFMRHPRRNCIYVEANHCKSVRRGDPKRIDDAVARYKAEGHPADYGLWWGGIILRRHTAATRAFNLEWWHEVSTGTSRDQISLPVVLRRLRTSADTLPNDLLGHKSYRHLK